MIWRSFCLLFLVSCGDAMVDGGYQGEPYFRVDGVFRGSTGEATIHSPQLGIIWPLVDGSYSFAGLDNQLISIQGDPLASTFSFEIWDLPPASAFHDACGARMALGVLAVYDDVNRDGRIDLAIDGEPPGVVAPDKALGLGAFYYLMYVEGSPSEENCEFIGFPMLAPGFQVLVVHDCETWHSPGAFVEVRLFPPADSFPKIAFEDASCSPEV